MIAVVPLLSPFSILQERIFVCEVDCDRNIVIQVDDKVFGEKV